MAKPAVDSAVIIGGGLGGLLTAIALRKVGIDAQVYEKAKGREESAGTLISIFPNGLKAIQSINPSILDILMDRGAKIRLQIVMGNTGLVLKEISADYVDHYKMPLLCIRWSRILDTFESFLPAGSIHTGCTFAGKIEEHEDGVVVFLEKDGKEFSVKTPLVIGADGIRSAVRKAILGDQNISARDNGRTIWRTVMPRYVVDDPMHKPCTTTMAAHAGTVAVSGDPGEGNLYLAFIVTDEATGGAVKERSRDGRHMKERLLDLFKEWPKLAPVIEAMPEESILERRVFDLPPLPTWHKGRVVIIGDAAHAVTPTLGQGANLTFEDALELARQLASHSHLHDALREYQDLRMPRVLAICEMNQAVAGATYGKPSEMVNKIEDNGIYNYDRLLIPLETATLV